MRKVRSREEIDLEPNIDTEGTNNIFEAETFEQIPDMPATQFFDVNQPSPQSEAFKMCRKFAPFAAKQCTGGKLSKQYQLTKQCVVYFTVCAPFTAGYIPPEALANAYSSGIGLTNFHVGVNGIPFYPINDEGSIATGSNAKIDYGSWGGGYSDNFGVRDYWTMNKEGGANWYEGLYGYKTDWSIPMIQSLGAHGGGGAQVHVPVKEDDFGKPLRATVGYFNGPYASIANGIGVDWLNGRIIAQNGYLSPLFGVSAISGSGFGFPSVSSMLKEFNVFQRAFGTLQKNFVDTTASETRPQTFY